jgi:hypothetical protein
MQTIHGQKIFNVPPTSNALPTANTHLTSKQYVDSRPAFITHQVADEAAGLTYSAANPTVFVWWEEP